MAGSIENMSAVYKKYSYVPPSPPTKLIDSSNFLLHFSSRKFLNIGLDPADKFNTVIHIITPSRFVNISPDFLKRIYSTNILMGNILSFILDQPQKYKRNLFLDSDSMSISSMVYQGENMLVIESKIQDGCRILLNRSDLLQLQYLEWTIFETVERKTKIIKPLVIQQINQIAAYLKSSVELASRSLEEMTNHVKSINNVFISSHVIGITDYNFTSELQLYAANHIAQRWMEELEKDEEYSEECSKVFSPPTFYSLFDQESQSVISSLSPPSPPSTQSQFVPIWSRAAADENDGPYGPQYTKLLVSKPVRRYTI